MTQISIPRFMSVATFQAISSPSDGDLVCVQLDTSDGVLGTFRYNSSSASAYKWEAYNTTTYMKEVITSENLSSSSGVWGNFPTVGPSITPPVSGEYVITFGASAGGNGSLSTSQLGVSVGGVDPVSAYSFTINTQVVGGTQISMKKTLAYGVALKLMGNDSNNSRRIAFGNRTIILTPIRVSTT